MLNLPSIILDKNVRQWQSMINNCIWKSKKPSINWSVAQFKKKKGGLGILSIMMHQDWCGHRWFCDGHDASELDQDSTGNR